MATLTAASITQPTGSSNGQYLNVNSSNLSTPTASSSSASTTSSTSSCAISSSNKQTNQTTNSPTTNLNNSPPQLADEDYLNKKMAFIQNHINNLLIEITNLPEPWTYAVTEDGRVFFIKYVFS